MLRRFSAIVAVAAVIVSPAGARATGLLTTANGFVQIGIQDGGQLDADTTNGFVGIGYKFTGQGGRTGFQDALTPGCPCEAWGVSANGKEGQIGDQTGTNNITTGTPVTTATSYTTNSSLTNLPGLTVSQAYSINNETATGGLFKDTVTITNGTGAKATDVRYARAMDWDVPPTEFSEFETFVGTTTTTSLLRSTDNGFASANPISGMTDAGIIGPINADGVTGPADHGAFFIFGFGDLDAGASYTFNILYGAGANRADALSLLSAAGPELYNLGNSSTAGGRADDLPTYVFAFNGVGGSIVVPPGPPGPTDMPEPASLLLLTAGLAGVGVSRRRAA